MRAIWPDPVPYDRRTTQAKHWIQGYADAWDFKPEPAMAKSDFYTKGYRTAQERRERERAERRSAA